MDDELAMMLQDEYNKKTEKRYLVERTLSRKGLCFQRLNRFITARKRHLSGYDGIGM